MIDKRHQVADQCKVVAHLCSSMAEIHRDYEEMIRSGSADRLIEQVGRRTAYFMEEIGNMLSNMDAMSEDDEWTNPIFERAQALWPNP